MTHNKYQHFVHRLTLWLAVCCLILATPSPVLAASQTDITGPSGSGTFGTSVTVLSNGNIVVTDPTYDIPGGAADVGAVYLYNGATGALISTLTGSTASDQVGSGGVTALSNGNYVVRSNGWDNGAVTNAGAVTWGNGSSGVSGVVSSSNSLVGSKASDQVGNGGVTALSNGNYVVGSFAWDNGTAADAGAVTWGNGSSGVSGVVSSSNSLVGSTIADGVGGVTALSNGNYVVNSSNWDNGAVADVGAVTWGSGSSGVSGVVSSSNSLVGSKASDQVGSGFVTALNNGNYLVSSSLWDNGAVLNVGAVTWGNGSSGTSGVVSSSNSLVGSTANDTVGSTGVTTLSNGNYVVRSNNWDNGAVLDAGAVTWGSGSSGVSGVVSSNNSLVGSKANDNVGSGGVTALSNSNYVVRSTLWDNGTVTNAGAVTWGNGSSGVSGVVSSSNSLVGSTASDTVGGNGVAVLSNGNYVVISTSWDNGTATDAGAVTWGNGNSGVSGAVSSSNSLVGSTASDNVGITGVTVLSNGHYLVRSNNWDNGAVADVGAVTWGNGSSGTSGAVSSNNSLVGSTANDTVGSGGVTALSNGNYVVRSPSWDNGGVANVGAVTWGSGSSGVSGVVSSSNSLVGSKANDQVGSTGVTALSNGHYLVRSNVWDNGTVANAGAVTWGNGSSGVSGVVSSSNSLVGSKVGDQVGSTGVTVLSNGNYVVISTGWDNGSATDAGAVTWGNGSSGMSGVVGSSNSLVGSTASDQVGNGTIIALSNGNYVVLSTSWDNGTATDAGAVTWGNGSSGVSGVVSSSNSLVGSTASDQVGVTSVTALSNGHYLVRSNNWDNGAVANAGAVTWSNGSSGVTGAINSSNSVLGTAASGGGSMTSAFDATNQQVVVGRPSDNKVTLFRPADDVTSAIGKLRTTSLWTSGAGAYNTIGYYTLAYNFTNNSATPRGDIYYEVTFANKAYLLDQNAGAAGGAVGAKKTIANSALPGGNNLWDTSETLSNQQFQVGITGSGWKLTLSIFAIDNTTRQKAQALGTIELSEDDLPAANQLLYLPAVQR